MNKRGVCIFFSDLLEETCIHPPSDESDVSGSPQVSLYALRQKKVSVLSYMYLKYIEVRFLV